MKAKKKARKPAKSAPKKNGRPSDYRPEFCQKAADLCVSGATDQEVADLLKVSVRTLYRWQSEHPEFRQALKAGKELPDERVIRSLYHRAVGYTYPAVKIMQDKGRALIVPYMEHVPPDVTAMIFWLKNRRPGEWRDRQQLEHSGPNGGPIQHEDMRERNLSAIDTLSARLASAAAGAPAAVAAAGSAGADDSGGSA